MKKSLVLTLLAVAALALFAAGCRKQENVNTDTAAVDTGVTTTGAPATDTAVPVPSTTDTSATTSTSMTTTTGTMAPTGATGTTGTTSTH